MKKSQNIFSIGAVRGLVGMLIGHLLGMGLVTLIRLLVGLEPYSPEPAWVVGALVGFVGFMYGIGSISDWLQWAVGKSTPDHRDDQPGLVKYFNFSMDHKVIGVQYGVWSLVMFLTAGLFALIFRTELIATGMQFLEPDIYNTLMSLHGIVMIMSILLGVGAMSNFLVPLLIGASDMLFPRLNGFAFWINVPSGILLLSSLFLGGFDTGWTGYPPLSVRAPLGMQMFFIGVYLFGLSSILGSLNIIATIIRLRAKGMTLFRMPVFVWTALATSIISLTATQLIALAFQLVMFQRLLGMGFFDPAKGGNVILFQHLFWFYSHPAVYVFILTGLGVISELLPVFTRKPLFGYKFVALSSLGIALVGFFVWAHHMFTSGMQEFLRVPFMYSTLLVAVPTGVKFFSWVATLWRGRISLTTPMLFVLGAVMIFLVGGLSGPPNGTVATDLHLHDSYFIVGHFHATMFGGYVFPFMAALYYWFPKVTGRMYNERLGKLHFWLMFPAFFVQSFGQMFTGLMGMRRRIADYDASLGLESTHLWITIAGFVIGTAVLIMIFNLVYSARKGEVAAANPWRSRSPEWTLPSPIPVHNYKDHPFEVTGDPYDYGLATEAFVTPVKAAPAAPAAAPAAAD
jgi:cytochrome c oxidase subunit 1